MHSAGNWNKTENGFLISRYKTGSEPFLFYEYHWDWDDVAGTVKPLEEIEKCPFDDISVDKNNLILLNYLDKLEEENPILHGYNSLSNRKKGAIKFSEQLSGKFKEHGKPKIHELIKSSVMKND